MTERISYIEIDLNQCSEVYSVLPCTASLSVDEPDKCFNCFNTCQDKENYNKETTTIRHSTVSARLPVSIDAVPDIKTISITAAKLDLGESMGQRASINISFVDARSPDTGPEGDRYKDDRDYDPYVTGTYWGKFRARYPFMKGEAIRLIRGNTDQTLDQMETRHFIIDSMAGPSSSGSFNIVCKDALKLTDAKKAQAPVLSQGELNADITVSETSITLTPLGIGDAEYPASGFVNLSGDEICSFTRASDVMTIVRAQFNTVAIEHEVGGRVQLCLRYANERVTDIIRDLLVTYSGVPSDYINLDDWTVEDETYINRIYSSLIPEPESANDLINELLQQTASTIWWDDMGKQIRFRVLKDVSTGAGTYTDDVIVANSFSAKDQESKRVSQVWTYFGQINPLESLDDNKNYSRTQVNVNLESELNYEGVPSIKRIYSRWIGGASRPTAERLNELILQRYATAPRLITYSLQRGAGLLVPVLGSGYNINTWTLQAPTGLNESVPIQLVQVKSSDTGYAIIGEEVLYSQSIAPDVPTTKPVVIEENLFNLNLFDLAISGESSNTLPVTGDTWIFTLNSEFTISSNSTSLPSLDTGPEESGVGVGDGWPSGVTIEFNNNGTVLGRGGQGGAGGNEPSGNGANGTDGGDAMRFNYDTTMVNNGIIGAGGGGGGGGGGAASGSTAIISAHSSGGGGGGGVSNSLGGVAGIITTAGIPSLAGKSLGANGQPSGVNIVNGNGGSGGFASSFDFFNNLVSEAKAGDGGDGGTAGVAGGNGQDGVATSNFGGLLQTGTGGFGGLEGDAINKNGFTVIITDNGSILGAIVT